jgi:cytochrome c-type biogenesis protein
MAAPFVLGAAFAFGWTPCTGPVLGSILTIAAQHDRAWTGGSLLLAYTLGLGLPFLACGLALGSLSGLLARVKPHLPALVVVSAAVMAVFGVLLVTDQLATLNSHLSNLLDRIGLGWLGNWS